MVLLFLYVILGFLVYVVVRWVEDDDDDDGGRICVKEICMFY